MVYNLCHQQLAVFRFLLVQDVQDQYNAARSCQHKLGTSRLVVISAPRAAYSPQKVTLDQGWAINLTRGPL